MTEVDLENALQRWLAPACAPAAVIWDRQVAHRPNDRPFATIRLVGPAGPGGAAPDWQHDFDPDSSAWAAGEEITETTRHDHEYVLRLTAYAQVANAARALALKAHDLANTRSGRETLDASGIAVVEVTPIQDVGAVIDTDWEGRVVVTIRIRVADLVTEKTNSIQTVGFDPASGFTT